VDHQNRTGYAQVLEEYAGSSGSLSKSYVIGDDVLGQTVGAVASWLLYDGHGSTRALANSAGTITGRFSFDAYGMTLGRNPNVMSPASTDLLYSGEQFDAGLQQQYLRARYYDQGTGTFASLDPFKGNNSDPQSLHKYAYAGLDPVNGVDLSGESWITQLVATVGIVATGFAIVSGGIHAAKQRAKENIFVAFAKGFLTSLLAEFPPYDIATQGMGDPFTGDEPSGIGLAFAFLGAWLPGSGASYRKVIEGTEVVATHPNGVPKILRKYVSKKRLQEIMETKEIPSSGNVGTYGDKVYLSGILNNHTSKDDIVRLNELPFRQNANAYIDIDTTGIENITQVLQFILCLNNVSLINIKRPLTRYIASR